MKLLFSLCLLFLVSITLAQEKKYSMDEYLDSLGLVFNPPKFLKIQGSTDCYDDDKILKQVLSCQINRFEINNQECRVYLQVVSYLSYNVPGDPLNFDKTKILDPDPLIHKLKTDLKSAYGEINSEKFNQLVGRYNNQQVKKLFNADMAINYKITLPKNESYPVDFTNVDVFMMRKDGRPAIIILILYSDRAKPFIKMKKKLIYKSFKFK